MPVADRCDRCGRCEAVTAQIWLLRSDDAAVDSSNPSMCVALVMLRFASIDAIGSLSANHWKLVARGLLLAALLLALLRFSQSVA